MRTSIAAAVLLLACVSQLPSPTSAGKDGSYYMAGSGNPNVNEKMYWADAPNILGDLDQFGTLYVEFHHCAWSMNAPPDEGSVDENDQWYQGAMPDMGANVAFSLYGSLKGHRFGGCGKKTFINSFYTNAGFEAFASAMYKAGASGFSNYANSYSSTCGGGYGVGCDYTNGFAVHTYSSDDCNPAYYSGVSDPMTDFNAAMNGAQCIQIYDAKNYNGNPYNSAVSLLMYSNACFVQNYFSPDGNCPDPYGRLAYYQSNFNKGIKNAARNGMLPYQSRQLTANTLQQVGIAFFVLAFAAFLFGKFGMKDPRVKKLKEGIKKKRAAKKEKKLRAKQDKDSKKKKSKATSSKDQADDTVIAPSITVGDKQPQQQDRSVINPPSMMTPASPERSTAGFESEFVPPDEPTTTAAPTPASTTTTTQPKKKKGLFGKLRK